MEEESVNITPEEKQALNDYLGYGAPIPEEKHNVHSFLHKVATADDTTKVGNLTAEEVGIPITNLRAIKQIALVSDSIMGNTIFSDYYQKKGEILTSTSLSKDAKLINLAITQKRTIEDQTGKTQMKENKGWFKKKNQNAQQEEQ